MGNIDIHEYLSCYAISKGSLPKISGRYSGGCVVCGDAACIWDDLEKFGCRSENHVAKWGFDFLTVNRMVEIFPGRIDHAYSNSGAVLNRFIAARRQEYINEFPVVTTHSRDTETNWRWPWQGDGTSGLGAILTAICLGYDQIVLCGMPLDDGPHNGEPHWRKTCFTTEVQGFDLHWRRAADFAFRGKVKSMSGRTRDWLGKPE